MRRHRWLILVLSSFIGCASVPASNKASNIRNCPKTVTVFIDKEAESDLRFLNIKIEYVLELVNLTFSSQNIDFRYDVKNLKIKEWNRGHDSFLNNEYHPDQYKIKLLHSADETKRTLRDNSEVGIFLTGGQWVGNGQTSLGWRVFFWSNYGRGVMWAGTALVSDEHIDREKKIYALAQVIAHEQGHLFGLEHVSDVNSLMHPNSSSGGGRLDNYSKKKLIRILNRERKCAAH